MHSLYMLCPRHRAQVNFISTFVPYPVHDGGSEHLAVSPIQKMQDGDGYKVESRQSNKMPA